MKKYYRLFVVLLTILIVSSAAAVQAQAAWAPNTAYSVGAIVTYGGQTYKCIQAHTSQVGWQPPNVPALWQLQTTSATSTSTTAPTKTNTPGGSTTTPTFTPTRTPTKSNTPTGASATPTKTNTPGSVTLTPTKTNTRTFTPLPTNTSTSVSPSSTPSGIAPWAPNVAYSVGTLVTYNGQTYKCINAHTSQVGWEPPNVPSLWQLQTVVPTNTPSGPTLTPGGPTATPGGVPNWTIGTAYKVGDVVLYQGKTYKCISAHTAIAGWEPATSPTLWTPYVIPSATPTVRPSITPGGPTLTPTATALPGSRKVAYFAQWGIYERNYYVKDIDTSGSAAVITHLNYAFGNVSTGLKCYMENRLGWGDSWADFQKPMDAAHSVDGVADDPWNQPLKGNLNQLKKLKAKYPNMKVLVSLGGWTWSGRFSDAALPENRVAFVQSCIDLWIKGNLPEDGTGTGGVGVAAGIFDGIDIDWEYPAMPAFDGDPARSIPANVYRPEDTANFTALLAEFRKQLNALSPYTGKDYLLTIAGPAGQDKLDKIELTKIGQYLDFINIMTYDFHGGWDATGPTNFHSPLFGSPNDPSTGVVKNYFADYAVNRYLGAGIPATKLLIGVPFYGRGWQGVTNANNGLYQPATGPATALHPYSDDAHAGVEDYKYLKTLGYPSFRDATTGGYYIFNGSTFWSFDDITNITNKMQYIKSKGLGGVMAWALDGDSNGELMKAAAAGLR